MYRPQFDFVMFNKFTFLLNSKLIIIPNIMFLCHTCISCFYCCFSQHFTVDLQNIVSKGGLCVEDSSGIYLTKIKSLKHEKETKAIAKTPGH